MKKKIIIGIIIILLFSFGFGIIYLNNVYLPIKIKSRIVGALETSLHYNVDIQKLKYSLIRGLIFQDIVIYDKAKDKQNTLLTIKEVSFNFLFLPLLKERKLIIPIIHIDSPFLNIRYQKAHNFNFSRIFLKPAKEEKKKTKFSFLIYKINIFQGNCLFTDERLSPEFSKTISDFNIGLTISPLLKVSFLIQGKLLTEKEAISKLLLQGEYNLLSKELNAKLNFANLLIPEFNPYLKAIPFSIVSGNIENTALDFKFKDNLISLKGTINTKGLELRKEKLTLMGDINIEPALSYALDKKILDYKTNFRFIKADLIGIQYLEKINNISGDIGLMNNKLMTDALKLQILDSPFMLKGTLEDFLNPLLKFNFTSEQLNLEKLLAILPAKIEGLNLNGTAKTYINIEGYLKKLPLHIKGNLQPIDAKFKTTLLKEPINNIKGSIDFTGDTVSWPDLSFNYLNTVYTSTGKLIDFKTPQINFGLASSDLNLKSDIKVKDNIIKINEFAGKYVDSEFDIKGNIDSQNANNPLLDLTGKLNLIPKDAFIFLPTNLAENLKKIKLDGNFNIRGSLNGRVKDYKDWNLSLKTLCDALSIYKLKFGNLYFNLEQQDGMLNINRFVASSYSGIINLEFTSNLKTNVPNYVLRFNGSGVNLAQLKSDTDLKDKDIAGIANITAVLNGDFKDLANLKGNGFLSIKDGNLWQLNLFKGLGELFLIEDYLKIIFKEAMADFVIENQYISTEKLRLTGDQLNLNFKGRLGFDGAVDFTVYSEANKNLIRDSADIRKFTTAIFGELGSVITIKVSGTIQKPKYSIVPTALDLLKSLKDLFLGK